MNSSKKVSEMSDSKNDRNNDNKGKAGMISDYDHKILDVASIGVLITRIGDGTILYANKMIAQLLGISDARSIVGTPVPDFYWDPKDRLAVLECFRAEGFVTNHDVRARRADGSMIWVAISIQPFTFEGEQVLLSEIVDVTERKYAEQAQRESEERFRSLYSNATIGLYRTTPDGRILMINPTGLQLLGFDSFEELAKRNLEESGFAQGDARKNFREKLEREGVIKQESVWTKKDGTSIFVRESSIVARDENGKVLYYDGSFEDITDRKRAEEAARTSEQGYQTIFNASPVMFWLKDTHNTTIQINRAAATFENVDPKDINGRSAYDLYPREQAEAFYQDDLQVIQSGQPKLGIIEKHTAPGTGKTTWLETGKVPIRNEKGEIIQILAFAVDITERQQSAEELNRLRNAIDQTGDGIALADLNGKILYANPAWANMHGYTINEILGENLSIFHTQEQLQNEVRPFNENAMAIGFNAAEIGHVRKDGTTFLTMMTVAVQKDETGAPVGLIGTARDITESKKAEARIRQTETRFRSIFDAANDAIFLLQGPIIVDCNPRTAEIFGATRNQVIGQTPIDFSPEYQPDGQSSAEKASALINLALAGQPQVFTWKHKRLADGVAFDTEISLNRVETGEEVYVQAIVRDITERKQAEDSLQKSEANLSSALRVANMGHWEFDIPTQMFTFNDQYYSLHGTTAQEVGGYQVSVQKFAQEFVHPEDAAVVGQATQQAIETTDPDFHIETEARILRADGETRWVTVWFRVEKDAQGRTVKLHGVNQDITERKQAENDLQRRVEIETLLTTISSRFVTSSADDMDQHINQSLEMLGNFAGADRSYLFMIADNGQTMDNTHEWCAEGVESHIGNLKDVPVETFPWLMESLKKFEVVNVPLVDALPVEAQVEKEEFQAEKIQSIIVVPIIYQDKLGGFMGYDAVSHQRTWETDTVTVLRTIGETFITTIERIKLEKEIQATFERRGYQVQISTEISQEVATASELNELFERVVTLTKERLGYYHTQLLRYDTAQDAVALIKGYGETGQKMLADGHKLPLGIGLIGTAAATGETVLRSTLADDPDWQPNPLLPETKGEIAVPIKWQNTILGVLDVQSDRAGALTEDDRLLLEGLCGQVAVAIEQTRLRAEMTERLEEVNRLYRSMSREGWKTYRETENLPTGFMFDQTGVRTVDDAAFAGESFTNVPMRVMGGEVVGNLAVVNDPQSPMSQEDLDFLQQVSEQVALALEGARLSAQTQSALAQTEKLSEAGLLFTRATDLQEVVKIAVETLGISQINRAILETFNYNSVSDVEGIDVIANWWNGIGLEPTAVGTHYTYETLPLLRLFLTPTPIFIEDAHHDKRVDDVSMQIVKKLNIHAVAVLPLFLADRQLGVLLLESEEVHEFNQDETRLFSAMGPQISTVLENRRQFERARQQAEREGMLNLISQKIQSATTVEAVLQIAARELGHALGAPMTIAQLSMKDKK